MNPQKEEVQPFVKAILQLRMIAGAIACAAMLSGAGGLPSARAASASVTAKILSGTVQSGGTSSVHPLAGAVVTLLEATEERPRKLSRATTDRSGRFLLTTPKVDTESIFYVTANLGGGVKLVTILGQNLPSKITINELTTVGAAYSMAQFYKKGVISGNSFGLRIAAGMNDNIVSTATGESSAVLMTSPNADQTNSLRSTRALANLLAACVQNHAIAKLFFEVATPLGCSAPRNTPEALANIARNPGQSVEAIFSLPQVHELYLPTLESIPDAWTVTVKVNDTGSDSILFGGLGNIVFDARGFAWIINNVVQGTTYSSQALMVLKPNGQPADGSNGSPRSPIEGGGVHGGGFGICIDPWGTVWEGNFGWGGVNPSPAPPGSGSVSQFTASGQPISPPNGYYGGVYRAQGLASDALGNIWIPSNGNDRVCVFLKGDPNNSICFQEANGSKPFDVRIATDGTAWVTNTGNLTVNSSIAKFKMVQGKLQQQFLIPLGSGFKGMSLDSQGNAWVASGGDSKIYGVRPNGTVIGGFDGGGVDGPWSVTVDGEDNLWVANFGPLSAGSNFTSGRISKVYGSNSATRPPGLKTGHPISPSTGFTVPSAGSQVLLYNGDPLYGPGAPPCFSPLMRLTQVMIDQAGNVWALNNWKPDFDIDFLSNPGGDGAVIFVGLAPPPRKHFPNL